jgi:hypothetical protein
VQPADHCWFCACLLQLELTVQLLRHQLMQQFLLLLSLESLLGCSKLGSQLLLLLLQPLQVVLLFLLRLLQVCLDLRRHLLGGQRQLLTPLPHLCICLWTLHTLSLLLSLQLLSHLLLLLLLLLLCMWRLSWCRLLPLLHAEALLQLQLLLLQVV